ncbi:MAG: precorrin-3B C(17)-methyltransferase [Pseudomonadota bacterium]
MSVPAIVLLSPGALPAAHRIRAALGGAELYGFAPRVEAEVDVTFSDLDLQLAELFEGGRPIVGICAAGILIRKLAPLLDDKTVEPPVIAVAEDGSMAVPLLGGHHGANRLARQIASALGGQAAVTTAGDVRFGAAIDEPPPGWRLGNPAMAKRIMAGMLAGEPVRLEIDAARDDAGWLKRLPFDARGQLAIRATHRAETPRGDTLLLHPAVLAVGIGCDRGAPPEEAVALVKRALADAGLAAEAVACVASIALKAAEPAVHAVAAALGVPARFFAAATLEAETPRLANPSEAVFQETGCHGVAEGAALAAVGPSGRLIAPKRKTARVTCAIAESPRLIDPNDVGHARGLLMIVGIGPGSAEGRTAGAEAALSEAEDVVGYSLYLDLVAPLIAGKTRYDFPLGEETGRVRKALDLAASGRRVALVSSGDAGIYAMAALVFELIEAGGNPDWERVEIRSLPGVSAMQAAAALVGAPLGHDFCAISLSDLLTPWSAIERRLEAAAAGDFVVALYNPVSQRRRDQLVKARAILLQGRPGSTPVVLARNLGREREQVTVTTLDALSSDQVDMLTVVLVGSSQTRRIPRPDGGEWIYTPRGYAAKREGGENGGAEASREREEKSA